MPSLRIPGLGGFGSGDNIPDPRLLTIVNKSVTPKEKIELVAFIKGDIGESLSPSWDESPIFGRVDNIARYTNTRRTVNFTFLLLIAKHDVQQKMAVEDKKRKIRGNILQRVAGFNNGISLGEIAHGYKNIGKNAGHLAAAASRNAARRIASQRLTDSGNGISSDWIGKYLDNRKDVDDKLEKIRKLVYPLARADSGVYEKPPIVTITLTNKLAGLNGYITDLSVNHLIESGIGVDTFGPLGGLISPMMYEVSITFTILHSNQPHNRQRYLK